MTIQDALNLFALCGIVVVPSVALWGYYRYGRILRERLEPPKYDGRAFEVILKQK